MSEKKSNDEYIASWTRSAEGRSIEDWLRTFEGELMNMGFSTVEAAKERMANIKNKYPYSPEMRQIGIDLANVWDIARFNITNPHFSSEDKTLSMSKLEALLKRVEEVKEVVEQFLSNAQLAEQTKRS